MATATRCLSWLWSILAIGYLGSIPVPAQLEATPNAPPLLAVVGVCPGADGSPWMVVWHPGLPGVPQAQLLFNRLESPEFNSCLKLLITSDQETNALVSRLRNDSPLEEARRVMRTVQARWRAFGVDKALEEVAQLGTRGKKVDELLEACELIRREAR